MRILRLSQRIPPLPGGQEVHVGALTRAQADRGASIHLLFAQGETPSAGAIRSDRVDLEGGGLPSWWPEQQRFAWSAVRTASRAALPVDLVHAHGDYAAAWAALRLARRLRCPAVLTVHGGLSERPAHRALSRGIFPGLDHVIAVSEAAAGQLRDRGVSPARISVIPSGVDLPVFAPLSPADRAAERARWEVPPDGVLAVSAGRLHPVKGYPVLIRAALNLFPVIPGLRLVIAGEGPERGRLQALAGTCRGIQLAGALGPEPLARLLGAADLFVLASIELPGQREGTPISIMEAMAAGLPVVASRTGGIPGLVAAGENGLLVPPGDEPELRRAISELAADPALRRRLGERGRRDDRLRDWAQVAGEVDAVYSRLPSGGAGG